MKTHHLPGAIAFLLLTVDTVQAKHLPTDKWIPGPDDPGYTGPAVPCTGKLPCPGHPPSLQGRHKEQDPGRCRIHITERWLSEYQAYNFDVNFYDSDNKDINGAKNMDLWPEQSFNLTGLNANSLQITPGPYWEDSDANDAVDGEITAKDHEIRFAYGHQRWSSEDKKWCKVGGYSGDPYNAWQYVGDPRQMDCWFKCWEEKDLAFNQHDSSDDEGKKGSDHEE